MFTPRPKFAPRAPDSTEDQAIAALLDEAEAQAKSVLAPPQAQHRPLARARPEAWNVNPASKKPKKAKTSNSASLQDLEKKMQAAVEKGDMLQNPRGELNTFCQVLCKRPTAKGDVVVTHKRGWQEVLSMKILPLDLEVSSTYPGGVKLGIADRKHAEAALAGSAIAELLQRLQAGELEIPTEALPVPVVGSDGLTVLAPLTDSRSVRPGDYKSYLNSCLQKMQPNAKDNRIFNIDLRVGYGTLKLPTIVPEVVVECGLMDLDDGDDVADGSFHGHHSQKEASLSQNRFEHKLAHLALLELVSRGLVTHDPTDPTVHAFWPTGAAKPGVPAEVSRPVRPAQPAPARRLTGSQRLREWQESWNPVELDSMSETCTCRPDGAGEKVWEVNIRLEAESLTGRPQIEGNGSSERKADAFEQAAEELMLQLEEVLGILPEPEPLALAAPPAAPVPRRPPYVPPGRPNFGGKSFGKSFGKAGKGGGYPRPHFGKGY